MTCNVLKAYINLTKSEINDYMKLIFEKKYLKRISDQYIEAYLNVRFYNFYKKDEELTFRKNFLNAIKEAEIKIEQENPKDAKLVRNMGLFYDYILYFDKISYRIDLTETIDKLFRLRKRVLRKDNEDFKNKFLKTYVYYVDKKEEFLNQFASEQFSLKVTPYEGISDVNKVILEHHIDFPEIYSEIAIEKTFNSGITKEDKLFVEYSLICINVINDIARGNFKKQYIIEFAPTILKKTKKLKSLLNIINNPTAQDKLNIKIKYEDFTNNKELIYDLMREGFKFAVILDNTIDTTYGTLQKLNAFRYIIISKNLRNYNGIMENKIILKNIIEI